ncbi:hypothetical protein D3C75_969750 [compost metagenome]
MSSNRNFSTAVVLSPGVWQQFIEPATGNAPAGQPAQRLAALLNSALTAASRPSQCPIELQVEHPQSGGPSVAQFPSLVQLACITPRSGPPYLLIRLPGERAVDITAL